MNIFARAPLFRRSITSKNNCDNHEHGFTLVEVLISLFVFSILSVATFSALSASIQGKEKINTKAGELAQFQTMISIIRSDMGAVVLRPVRDRVGDLKPFQFEGGFAGKYDEQGRKIFLDFTRSGRTNPGGLEKRGDLQRIIYSVQNGQLIRASLTQVNPSPQTSYFERVLMKNITSFDLNFIVLEQTPQSQFSHQTIANWHVQNQTDREGAITVLPEIAVFDIVTTDGNQTTHYVEVGL